MSGNTLDKMCDHMAKKSQDPHTATHTHYTSVQTLTAHLHHSNPTLGCQECEVVVEKQPIG